MARRTSASEATSGRPRHTNRPGPARRPGGQAGSGRSTQPRGGVELSRLRDSLASLFARRPREDYLAQYVIRECSRGRTLAEVLDDPYVVNRSTREERARLLERPEVIEAVGKHL